VADLTNKYRPLKDDDVLCLGDETACTSLLNSTENYEGWNYVEADAVGLTVEAYKRNDMDAAERVFRRRVTTLIPTTRTLRKSTGPFLRGKEKIELSFTVQRGVPNKNGDTFDLPYQVVDGDGKVVGEGVFEGCYVSHVNIGEIDGSVMRVEPVELTDRVLPFRTSGE
jgi:hypothetical protein